jgi:sugar phosphate isomerase/epimerase
MSSFRLGCQTFTWEMLGDRWRGTTDELLDAIATAGYAGLEITDHMIGPYAHRGDAFARALSERGLTLVAFAWASATGFTMPEATAADIALADRWLAFVSSFPGAVLSLGSATATAPGARRAQLDCAARIYDAIGRRGAALGVKVAFHPSSHEGSVLTGAEDYEAIMAATDPSVVGWVPDTGHILKGGMDVRGTLRRYGGRIAYVHLKDAGADGSWKPMGDGEVGIPDIVAVLRDELSFAGWLVAEEEAPEAGEDPAGAVLRNRRYLAGLVAEADSSPHKTGSPPPPLITPRS